MGGRRGVFGRICPAERREKMRQKRRSHYPGYRDANERRDSFKEAEMVQYKAERLRKFESRRKAMEEPLYLNLDRTSTRDL